MRCVEIAMGELVPHSRDVSPRHPGLVREQTGVDVLHRFANLDEADADRVED
jgi:hypothetical protein